MAKKPRKNLGDANVKTGSLGAEQLGLEPPYPAAPYRPTKYCLYVTKNENLATWGFTAAYAAKKFLEILLADDTLDRITSLNGKPTTILSSSGIKVFCDEIDELLDYEYTANEKLWGLNEPEFSNALRFRNSSGYEQSTRVVQSDNADQPKKEKPQKIPKPSKEGLISIAEIAASLKMEPRDARAALRAAKVEKPVVGWAWSKSEVDTIKKILQNNN